MSWYWWAAIGWAIVLLPVGIFLGRFCSTPDDDELVDELIDEIQDYLGKVGI